ncbi:MAG: hypothetical protein HC875_05750 [Anaerolineales bacterium]|nr:hypothetical protein [Anaerolineales bacterium]
MLFSLILILMFLLSGCGFALTGAAAASSTPTIVPLPAVTQTPAALPSPSASSMAAPATPTLVPVIPTATATAASPTAVAVQSAGVSAVEIASAAPSSLSGTWNFNFGQMTLTQQGSRVEGTYQWYGGVDTGKIKGVVVTGLNQFQGVWISDRSPNSQSLIRWQLAGDYNSFSGISTGGSTSEQWCGVRSGQSLPAGCGFSGDWQLRFGNPAGATGQATLVQTGGTVQGTYSDSQGRTGEIVTAAVSIQSITEVKLNGTWRNDQGEQDSFEWRLDLTTGRTFQGRRDPGNSEWCGWREGAGEPKRCGWSD